MAQHRLRSGLVRAYRTAQLADQFACILEAFKKAAAHCRFLAGRKQPGRQSQRVTRSPVHQAVDIGHEFRLFDIKHEQLT